MIDVMPMVLKALRGIRGVKAFFYFPDSFAALPCVSYYEADNAPDAFADDSEYTAEIIYVVDVWGKTIEQTANTSIKVDAAMKKIGFIRELAHDVSNPASTVKQRTMRFKLIA